MSTFGGDNIRQKASQVAVVEKNLPASAGGAGDMDLIPESARSPGGGHGSPLQYSCLENFMDRGAWWAAVHSNGTPLQYSCLENPMDGGAWWAAVHGVAKSQTRLSDFTSLFTFMHWRRKWQPTPVVLPGESQGRRSLVGCRPWGHTESDMTEAT